MREGLIVKGYGGFFFVRSENSVWQCRVRGQLRYKENFLLVGDRVTFEAFEDGTGVIKDVFPRKNSLYRPPIANVDQAVIVMPLAQPEFDMSLLDRILVLCEIEKLNVVVCFNKLDLVADEYGKNVASIYQKVGYTTVLLSAIKKIGLESLKCLIENKISVLAGPSGAGKSTLLNAFDQTLALQTGEVSKKNQKGRHTTTYVELLKVAGGYVADTPGFSNLTLPRLKKTEVGHYFPEIRMLARQCRFSDCLHMREPDCAVKEALSNGEINSTRYNNYLSLLSEVIQKERIYR